VSTWRLPNRAPANDGAVARLSSAKSPTRKELARRHLFYVFALAQMQVQTLPAPNRDAWLLWLQELKRDVYGLLQPRRISRKTTKSLRDLASPSSKVKPQANGISGGTTKSLRDLARKRGGVKEIVQNLAVDQRTRTKQGKFRGPIDGDPEEVP
jgi:hypothetical protein